MTDRIDAALAKAETLHRLVDEGYRDPAHPDMGGSVDCPTCNAERNLNRLANPHGYLAAIRALRDIAGNHTADNQPRCECIDCEPAWRVLDAFADAVEVVR